LVPLLYLSGGVEAYLRESALLARRASAGTSLLAGPEGVGYNLVFLAVAVGVGLAFALVPLGLWATRLLRFTLAREPHRFFLWWILPSVVLFALSHTGQYGYTLVILPPLLVLSSLCVRVLVDSMKPKIQSPKDKVARDHVSRFTFHASSLALGACASLALLSAAYFTLAQGPVTASNIVGNDQYWRAVQREMGQYVPGETVLLTSTEWGGPFRAAGYLLPVFHIYATGKDEQQTFGWLYSAYGGRSSYALPHSPANSYLALPQGVHMLVAMDADTAERLGGVENVESSQVSLPGGPPLYILRSYAPIAGIEIEQQRLRPTYERAAKP
jgi:hypothetical protein